jgi:hypothetical protein
VPIITVTFISLRERPIGSRTAVRKPVALTLLPRRKAPAIIAALTLGLVCRPVAERLWGVRGGARLRLKSLLRLLISALSLGGRGETIRERAEIAIVLQVIFALSGRPLLTTLRERLRGLRGCNKTEVMFGVLQIILRRHRISARVSVSR